MDFSQTISRRHVVRQFVLGTVGWGTAGGWFSQQVLGASLPVIQSTATVLLPFSVFPVLEEDGGSVRLEVGLDQPIVISRSGNTFYAVGTRCTHNGCTVSMFDSEQGAMVCPCHGSRFHIDGRVQQGPAELPLDRFAVVYDAVAQQVKVTAPGVTFRTRNIQIISTVGATKRIRLSFQANVFTNYQVIYQTSLAVVGSVRPFSLTAGGATTQTTYRNTVFNPNNPTPIVDLYVEVTGSTGFFSISHLPTEV